MAIAEISIIPLGTKTPSVSKYVARAVKVLQQERDLKYQITSMGTIIEGRLDKILAVAEKMHEGTFGREVTRVITIIEIDDRRDQASSIKGKMNSLMTELKH
jgi:uncharacterized protein (TIGR00106 family)